MTNATCVYIGMDRFDARQCPSCHKQVRCEAYALYQEDLTFEGRDEVISDIWADVQAEYAVMV